jgi:heterodisulfide reductase subunit B
MKYALFLGCNIPARLNQYESSARAVMQTLGIEIVDIQGFNCCGYPLKNVDFKTAVLFSARNLALAAQKGLDIISLCKCCFGSLKKTAHLLKEDQALRSDIEGALQNEGLTYAANAQVKHFLSVLYHDIGVQTLKGYIKKPFRDLNIATHYGCHALRPSKIMSFDDPVAPTVFDELVEVTGAKSVYWPKKLDCCGAPVLGINDSLSLNLTRQKLQDGQNAGAHYICAACTYCQLQFDTVQQKMLQLNLDSAPLPSILYPQLLGLSMGLEPERLDLDLNQISIDGITAYAARPVAAEA